MNSIDTFDNNEHDDATQVDGKDGDTMMGQPAMVDRADLRAKGRWVTTGQAKQILGVSSVNTVKRWVAEGKLDAQKFDENGWMRISVDSIGRLLQSGDENVKAFQRLKQKINELSDLDFEITDEDYQEMSDNRADKLPWGGSASLAE